MATALDAVSSDWFATVLLMTLAGEFLVPLALARHWRAYDGRMQALSVLGCPASPVRWAYRAWLVWLGAVMLGCALMQYGLLAPADATCARGAACCLAAFGIGAGMLAGAFPCGATKDDAGVSARVHGVASALGFMALLAVPVLKAGAAWAAGAVSFAVLDAACFCAALACFVLFVMADKPRAAGTPVAWEGVWERGCLVAAYLPLVADALVVLT